uniref:Retrotransposon protein, putative, Ty3-gypsy subclass n=2 Tax=Oryza sativa subsp. japonica TaxID=39947 RepID=Q53KB2_ORYSJ|nr:retrotransposon protein, putative, Ty3-gypsy sub-class [Oryza sativa Japonica Group]ABA93431.1 retrotransposon protein, putative, Ty3-gypsy subclass [Oryza sativa Japonica Group]
MAEATAVSGLRRFKVVAARVHGGNGVSGWKGEKGVAAEVPRGAANAVDAEARREVARTGRKGRPEHGDERRSSDLRRERDFGRGEARELGEMREGRAGSVFIGEERSDRARERRSQGGNCRQRGRQPPAAWGVGGGFGGERWGIRRTWGGGVPRPAGTRVGWRRRAETAASWGGSGGHAAGWSRRKGMTGGASGPTCRRERGRGKRERAGPTAREGEGGEGERGKRGEEGKGGIGPKGAQREEG